jgi:hypothetical protein
VRKQTDGLRVFSQVETGGDAPRWSDASGCSTAQRQPVFNAVELALSMPDRLFSRDNGAANSRVMQKLDDHDLDVIVQVRKFGERFDHPFLECCP